MPQGVHGSIRPMLDIVMRLAQRHYPVMALRSPTSAISISNDMMRVGEPCAAYQARYLLYPCDMPTLGCGRALGHSGGHSTAGKPMSARIWSARARMAMRV